MKRMRHWKDNSMPVLFIMMRFYGKTSIHVSVFCAFQAGSLPLALLIMPLCQVDVFSSLLWPTCSTHSSCTPERLSFLSHLTAREERLKAHLCCLLWAGTGGMGVLMRTWKTTNVGSSSFLSTSLPHKGHLWSPLSPLPPAKVKERTLLQTPEERDCQIPRMSKLHRSWFSYPAYKS